MHAKIICIRVIRVSHATCKFVEFNSTHLNFVGLINFNLINSIKIKLEGEFKIWNPNSELSTQHF